MNFFGNQDCFKKTYCCFPRVYATGNNYPAALGNDASDPQVSLPLDGTTPGHPVDRQGDWIKVATNGPMSLGILSDGSLWAWGSPTSSTVWYQIDKNAVLGDGTLGSKSIPVFIDAGPWRHVSVSLSHAVGIKQDGTLWSWGGGGTATPTSAVRAALSSSVIGIEDGGLANESGSIGGLVGHYDKKPSVSISYVAIMDFWWMPGHGQVVSGPGQDAEIDFDMDFWIDEVSLDNAGSGYRSTPSILIDGVASGALRPLMDYRVESIRVDKPGSGYVNGATVLPVQGLRSVDATAEVSEYTYLLTGAVVNDGGSHASPPEVLVDGVPSDSITPVVGYSIAEIRLVRSGKGYTQSKTEIVFYDDAGVGAAAQFQVSDSGSIESVSLSSGGTGYSKAVRASVVGDGSGAEVSITLSNGTVLSLVVNRPIAVSVESPSITFSGTGGGSATAITQRDGIKSIRVINNGRGYGANTPRVKIVGPCATEASASPVLGDGVVSSISIDDNYRFKSEPEQISFSGGSPDADASCSIVRMFGKVDRSTIRVVNPGSGYTTSSQVKLAAIFTKAVGDGGTAQAVDRVGIQIAPSPVNSLSVVGTGLPTTSYLAIDGGGGYGARGSIQGASATLIAAGEGYTSEPSVSLVNFPPWPVQIGSSTGWTDAVAADGRSAGIDGGTLYWWGDATGGDSPHPVGKRVVVNGDEDTPKSILEIGEPDSAGFIAKTDPRDAEVYRPQFDRDGGWPTTVDILWDGGAGYTSPPTVTKVGGGTIQASLEGPGSCRSVHSSGSSLYAVDSGGYLWQLGGVENFYKGSPNKVTSFERTTRYKTVPWTEGSDGGKGIIYSSDESGNRTPVLVIVENDKETTTVNQTPTRFSLILKDGGSGYSGEVATLWCKGQKTRVVWTKLVRTKTGGPFWSNETTDNVYTIVKDYEIDSGERQIAACTLWQGEVVDPPEVNGSHSHGNLSSFSEELPDMSDASNNGRVVSVEVLDGGGGYTSPPAVTISDELHHTSDPRFQATATATVSGGKVTSVTVTNGGQFFNRPPFVVFSGGGGTGARARSYIEGFTEPNLANPYIRYDKWFAAPVNAGQFEVRDASGNAGNAVYEIAGPRVSGTFRTTESGVFIGSRTSTHSGPVKIGSLQFDIASPPAAISNSNKLYFMVPASTRVAGIKYPEQQQISTLSVAGYRATRSDQSFWELGGDWFNLPLVNGNLEVTLSGSGTGYTLPATAKLTPQDSSVAAATTSINGEVVAVGVISGGSGYRFPPTISFSGGGGGGASYEAVIAGPVESVEVTSGGSGYLAAPLVKFSQPGISAKATATASGFVASVSVLFSGVGYRSPPTVSLVGGGGSGATATATLSNTGVASVTITNGGSGYTSSPKVIFSDPSGSRVASGKAVLSESGGVESVEVSSSGGGYVLPPAVYFSGGGGAGATATATLSDTGVASVTITNGGSGYTSAPKVVFSEPPPQATASAVAGIVLAVDSVSVDEGGRYRSAPSVTFEADKTVDGVSVSGGGSGYSSPPAVLIESTRGSGARAYSKINASVVEIYVADGGSGYTSAPVVELVGCYDPVSGSTATATANISQSGRVVSVSISGGGDGYYSPPEVILRGGGGKNARAAARIAGPVSAVVLESPGSGYKDTPSVFFMGGGGTGASATASVSQAGSGAAATCKINGSVIYAKQIQYGSGYASTPVVSVTGGGNERLAALDQQLSLGEITQEQFDTASQPLQAAMQARVLGPLSGAPAIASGGSGYGLQNSRHGDKMIPSPTYYGATTSGLSHALATPTVSGGSVGSVSLPDQALPPIWYRAPAVEFANTKILRCETRLRYAGVGLDSGRWVRPATFGTVDGEELNGFLGLKVVDSLSTGGGALSYDSRNYQFTTGHGARARLSWNFNYLFSDPPLVEIQGETGAGATASIPIQDGLPSEQHWYYGRVKKGSEGSGYGGYAVSVFSGGRPLVTYPTASATVINGRVIAITVTSAGSGFTRPPKVIIHGGGGTGTLGVAVLIGGGGFGYGQSPQSGVAGVVVTDLGSGYTSTPTVSFIPDEPDFCDYLAESSVVQPAVLMDAAASRLEYLAFKNSNAEDYVECETLPVVVGPERYLYSDGYVTKVYMPDAGGAARFWSYSSPPAVVFEGDCESPASAVAVVPKWSTTAAWSPWTSIAVRDVDA